MAHTPIPANISLTATVSDPECPKQCSTKFNVGSIDRQSKDTRKLFRDLKYRATHRFPGTEVEFGAFIIEYTNGTSKVVRFTSNNRRHILGKDYSAALNKSRALIGAVPVVKITFIHTHPERGAGNTSPITPSAADYLALKELEGLIEWSNGTPNLVGIVLPNSPATQDSFFLFRANGFSWIE
jgi:hypothetical protein